MTPQFDFFLLVFVLKSPVGKFPWYVDGKYGENKALNGHNINNENQFDDSHLNSKIEPYIKTHSQFKITKIMTLNYLYNS